MIGNRIFKYKAKKLGSHYHTAIYTGDGMDQTFALCGNVIFDEPDWESLKEICASDTNIPIVLEVAEWDETKE